MFLKLGTYGTGVWARLQGFPKIRSPPKIVVADIEKLRVKLRRIYSIKCVSRSLLPLIFGRAGGRKRLMILWTSCRAEKNPIALHGAQKLSFQVESSDWVGIDPFSRIGPTFPKMCEVMIALGSQGGKMGSDDFHEIEQNIQHWG